MLGSVVLIVKPAPTTIHNFISLCAFITGDIVLSLGSKILKLSRKSSLQQQVPQRDNACYAGEFHLSGLVAAISEQAVPETFQISNNRRWPPILRAQTQSSLTARGGP